MIQYDRMTLGRQAKGLGFVRDTFEKVCRLADVLDFMEQDMVLKNSLALKGGTAINLTIFDLPRLSVDIDLDFAEALGRVEMLEKRGAKALIPDLLYAITRVCHFQKLQSMQLLPVQFHTSKKSEIFGFFCCQISTCVI